MKDFTRLIDGAIASDGGSIGLMLERHDGTVAGFTINRSMKARGTPAFGAVTGPDGVLDDRELAALIQALEELKATNSECGSLIETFCAAARARMT